jgi:hypothetical protein
LEVTSSVSSCRVFFFLSAFVLFCLRNIFLPRFYASRFKADIAAYMWNNPVNSACGSRNWQRMFQSASALSAGCFHWAPFPFTLGEFRTSCPISATEAHARSISFSSGWSVVNCSYLSWNEASTARQIVSHCVGVARAMSLKDYAL